MHIWCMNLKDNRDEPNQDFTLKFDLCFEKSMIAIGWSVSSVVNTWDEYKNIADKQYADALRYRVARNNLERLKRGDLVWVKNPATGARYIVEITDDSPEIYTHLKEFDIFAYRKGKYHLIKELPSDILSEKQLRARHTLECMHSETRGETIRATIALFRCISNKK